jgi:hypothetical protein
MLRRILIVMLFVLGIMNAFAFDAEPQQTIVGQNNSAVDLQAVQKAVDQGGTILLKGTFDFGNEGRVNITKDVQIIGETNHKGPVTKIKGGFWTLHSPLPAQLPPTAPGPKITIQSIHFDGALGSAIHLAYSSGATITGNKITNIRPKPSDYPIFGKTGLNYQHGIFCGTAYAQPSATPKYIPDAFNGFLTITDNDIDLTNDVPTKTMAKGMMVIWTTGVNAQIQRNTIVNSANASIETIDNYLGKDGSGMFVIKDNKIVTSIEGLPLPTPSTPNCIIVGWFRDMSGGLDPQRNLKYFVVNNAIRTRGKTSCGIIAMTDGVVVVNNAILSEGSEAVSLFISSSDGYIAYNKAEGVSVNPAIMVRPWKPLKGSKNVIVDNDLKQFKSSAADAVFGKDSCNNLFIGPSCKVNDLGSNNLIQMTK